MDKYIGRLLDNRYEILEVLGTGGMAVVYKARCHRLNRLVAIKILKDDYMEDEEFRRRFHSESQAVAMLSHPNIVSVYDVSSSVAADYIVMELIDGITLKQYMEKKGVLNWKETLHFAIQIGKALEHAHSRGIVHRDIKPHNVMVLKNGSVKVTDFGIARMMSQSHTLTKEALGSVHYISPEQAKGGRVDNRSDIYSLGVVMYEMMSGRPPYDGESPVAVAIQHINGGAPMPSTLNPNIPAGLEQIIMHAMALEPGGRYATAVMMLADMDEFRKNPGILFDYNIPGMGEILKPQKPQLPEFETKTPTPAQTGEEKEEDVVPPIVIPPAKRGGSTQTGGGNRSRKPSQSRNNRKKDKRDEKESKAATIAIIACSALMVLAIVIFVIVLLSSGSDSEPVYVEVPNLIGQNYDDIKNNHSLNVTIELNAEVYSEEHPERTIVWQSPDAGGQIVKGSAIGVNISKGSKPVMPNILNMPENEAVQAMTQLIGRLEKLEIELEIAYQKEYDDTVEAGKVIRTEPVAGTELKENDKVTVVISLGMEEKTDTMIDVVGDEWETAKKRLETQPLNLIIDDEPIFDSTVPAGVVVRTDPEAGAMITTGQKVTVYVSKGPDLRTVPDVVGSRMDVAINILKGEGFQNYTIQRIASTEKEDTVIGLEAGGAAVSKNSKLDVNTVITIVVSDGPEESSDPPKTKQHEVMLPEDVLPPYKLTIKLGDQIVYEVQILDDAQEKITVELTGTGKQTYDVYINDNPSMKFEVDFTQ